MKQIVNFRLNNHTISMLSILEKKLNTSKTAIVEKALQFYAKKKLSHENPLLNFAGVLNEEESHMMLTIIESNKHNKDIKAKL